MSAPQGFEVRSSAAQTYAEVLQHAAAQITDANPWGARTWHVLLKGERDWPVARGIGFWRRHEQKLTPQGETREARRAQDGRLLTVGAEGVATSAELVRVLNARARVRFRTTVLVPRSDAQIDGLLDDLLDDVLAFPSFNAGYGWHGRLAVMTADAGCCVMAQDETERHEPCLVFYGDPGAIAQLRPLMAPFDLRQRQPPVPNPPRTG